MAHVPHGPVSAIRSKKELGQVLLGVGYLLAFVSILVLLIMLYGKSYKSSKELLLIAGIPGAISLVLLVLGNSFRAAKKMRIIFRELK